jgi:hypothetical protein
MAAAAQVDGGPAGGGEFHAGGEAVAAHWARADYVGNLKAEPGWHAVTG